MPEVFEKIIEKFEKIKTISVDVGFGTIYKTIRKDIAIEIVKQADEEYNNGWIPCNERLPDRCQYVLCTVSGNLEPKHEVVICAYNGEMFWHDGSITAWKPLPEPYQPKGE